MPTLCPTWEFISNTHSIHLHCRDDGDDLIISGFLHIYSGLDGPARIVLRGIPVYGRARGLAGVNPWSRASSSERTETEPVSTSAGATARSAGQAGLRRSERLRKRRK